IARLSFFAVSKCEINCTVSPHYRRCSYMTRRLLFGLLALSLVVSAQRRVDPKNSYVRVIGIVSLIGKGTADDPKRPQYAPWPASPDPNGIIGFFFQPTDD